MRASTSPGPTRWGRTQQPPFAAPKPLWMVQTKLEPLSADFTTEKPAFVQAFALVENGGDQDIIQWSQAVRYASRAPSRRDDRATTSTTTSRAQG